MLNEGEIALSLNGREYVLRPTLRALKEINAHFGGMQNIIQTLLKLNFNDLLTIIRIGAGVPNANLARLEDDLFRAGMTDAVLVPLIDYLQTLMNGGRPVKAADAVEQPEQATEGNA